MRVALFIFIILFVTPVMVEASAESSSQVVIIVPGLSFEEAEWYAHQGQSQLWSEAFLSAMNTKSGEVHSDIASMLTLATGRKASGNPNWQLYQHKELINGRLTDDLYTQLTGWQPAENLLHPWIGALQKQNHETLYRAEVGQFGERLKRTGFSRYVMGHSDTDHAHRFAGLLAMDKKGTVDGDVMLSVTQDPSRAYGKRMNVEWMVSKLSQLSTEKRFVVIEWGDIYRLFKQKEQMEEAHFKVQRSQALDELERFLGQLRKGTTDHIWLISPFVHQEAYANKQQLAPIYYWSPDGVGGSFYSGTTKRQDVMSNIDIVPTFIEQLQLEPSTYDLGFPLKKVRDSAVTSNEKIESVKQSEGVFRSRSFVLSTYISCLAFLLIIAGCITWFKPKKRIYLSLLQAILLSALSSPLWFLLLAGVEYLVGVGGFIALVITCSLLWGALFQFLRDIGLYLTASITLLAINIDTFLASPLMSHSYLGYDPIIGARYYGIGNEYIGVYIIYVLIVAAWMTRITNKYVRYSLLLLLWMTQCIIIGHPQQGANAGGFLSAVMTIAYWFIVSWKEKLSVKKTLLLFVISVVGSLILLFVLQKVGTDFSHIGKAYERLLYGDISFILDTILRKLEMNLKLFKHSNWTQLLVTSYLIAAMILWWNKKPFRERGKRLFIKTGTVCSVILLLINDSGVVAAAISMFCVVATYFYWVQMERMYG